MSSLWFKISTVFLDITTRKLNISFLYYLVKILLKISKRNHKTPSFLYQPQRGVLLLERKTTYSLWEPIVFLLTTQTWMNFVYLFSIAFTHITNLKRGSHHHSHLHLPIATDTQKPIITYLTYCTWHWIIYQYYSIKTHLLSCMSLLLLLILNIQKTYDT